MIAQAIRNDARDDRKNLYICIYNQKGNNTVRSTQGRVQRQGQIYRFSIAGTDYAAFVWRLGTQFRGRVEGQPQVPELTARTALAVRDALQQWLVARSAST